MNNIEMTSASGSGGRPLSKPSEDYANQGNKFTTLVMEHKLSIGEVSQKTGLSIQMLYALQSGKALPSANTKAALSKILGEEAIKEIGWPKAKSPTTRSQLSKIAPPGSLGATLRKLRLEHPGTEDEPGPPTQAQMAALIGIGAGTYRYLERDGGKHLKQDVLNKLLNFHGYKLWQTLSPSDPLD